MAIIQYLPVLTLIPVIFTLIAIILINVGGFTSYSHPPNSAFQLASWNYTLTPRLSTLSYRTNIYLSRLCYAQTQALSSSPSTVVSTYELCPTHPNGRNIHASNLRRVRGVNPFRFSTLVLDVPFAFFILAAVGCVLGVLVGLVGACECSRLRRGVDIRVLRAGMGISVLTLIFLLVASSVLTYQTTHLVSQIRHNTPSTVRSPYLNSGIGRNVGVILNSVELGTTALGLMWGAVVAMVLGTGMWGYAWWVERRESRGLVKMHGGDGVDGEEEPPRYELGDNFGSAIGGLGGGKKVGEERYVQGGL